MPRTTALRVNSLYRLPKNKWWMQADRGCDKVPPPAGQSLNLPARGKFTVDLGANRGSTSFSYGGKTVTQWSDCSEHSEDWHAPGPGKCLVDNPDGKGAAMHTQNYTTTAGTACAISYQSDIKKVTMKNLVMFVVVEQYMENFRCNVTSAVSPKQLGNQAEGNNVPDVGYSPGYNARMGFKPGAQNDIFV
ncbi:hypothetical protein CaCOL14_002225 [Colletotrichum acutatum]